MTSLTAPDFQLLFESAPGLYLVLLPDFTIAAVSNAYLTATNCKKEDLIGHNIFAVFPDNPDDFADDEASCMINLRASLNYVTTHRKPQKMAVQKYSLPGPDGEPEDRYRNPHNKPVFNEQKELVFIIHEVEDVTTHVISEKKFFDFLEAAMDATIIMDKLGAIKIANDYACKLFGYSKEELVGEPVEILLPGELKEMHRNQRKHVDDSASMREMNSGDTFIAVKKNGIRFPVEINLSPVITDEGILVCATIKDIAERKLQLEKMELLLRQINQANDAILTVDANRNITSWNNGAEKLYGYSREEAIGKESMSFLRTDISQDEMDLLTYTIASHDHFTTELKRKTKAGNDIYIQASISTIKNNSGEITGYVAVNIDITEQKKLREQVTYLASLTEQSSDAIISRAPDRSLASWNLGAEKLFGFSKEEAIGKTAVNLGISKFTVKELEEIDNAFFERGTWKAERLYYRKNGTSFWGSVTGNVVRNDAGKLISEVFFIKDINKEKELGAALQKSNEELEAKVKERTSEIEKSEKKYRYLFENNPLPMWITDMDSLKFLAVNKMAVLNYGYSREEFLQMTAVDIRPDEEKALFVQYVHSDETNETNYHNGVWQHLKKDGSIIQVEIIVHHINFEGIPARLVLANDVTEKKKAEEKLVTSEKRFRTLIENNYDMISLMDTSFKIIYRSPSAERITGWSLEEMQGVAGTAYIHPDDLEHAVSTIQDVMKNPEKARTCSFRSRHKNGHYLWVEGVIRNLLHEDGINAIVFNFRDITSRKEAETKVKASENRFRALIENNFDIISLMDASFKLIYRSPSAERITGWTNEDMVGLNATVIIHPDDLEMAQGIINNLFQHPGKSFSTSFRYRHKNGHYIWVEGSLINLLDEEDINAIVFNFRDINARKEAEKKLASSEERFRALIENNNDMISLLDSSFKIVYRSPSATRITGWTDEDVKDMSMLQTVHPDDIDIQKQNIQSIFNSHGNSINTTIRIRHKQGHYIWMEGSIKNLLKDENIKALVFNFRDVTEQKLAEERIITSEERFRHTLDNMLEGVQILDFDLRYLYVNDAMAKHGRYPKEQFIGKSVKEMYPGIEKMQVFEAYQNCLNKRETVHLENEFLFPDGSVGWFELSFQPVPEGLFILSVDITERKHTEVKLNDQRAQLKTLGDNLTGVMIYQLVGDTDGNRQFTYVSDGVKRLTGKTPEEVMADPSILYYMLVEEDREKFMLAELEAGQKMSIFNIEVRCRNHNDEIRWLNIVSTPRVQENGKVVWDGFHIDITERKEVEEKIKHLNTELEEKIAIRTEQLKKSIHELEAFSYSVSHDLRAPLRGIIGFTSILEDEYSNKLDDEAKRITGIIKSNTLKMGSLIDDLLAFSRIGQQEIDKINFDSSELVKQTIAGIDNKNGTIEWVIQPLHKAYGDYTTIRQVWINLIANAVKYSSGKEKQCITTGSYEEQDQVVFFVKDNGVGFDKKYAEKLFKVFQRLHSTTEFEGTGIGLAIVEKIISKHGGRVWADAEKGEGACFYFSLPKQETQSI